MRYWHDNEMMANQGRLLAAFIPEMGMFKVGIVKSFEMGKYGC